MMRRQASHAALSARTVTFARRLAAAAPRRCLPLSLYGCALRVSISTTSALRALLNAALLAAQTLAMAARIGAA